MGLRGPGASEISLEEVSPTEQERSTRALAAAERIDTAAAASQWEALKRRNDRSPKQAT
jgi:hypothetical protein